MRKYLAISLVLVGASFGGTLEDLFGSRGGKVGTWLGDVTYKIEAPNLRGVEIYGTRYYYMGGFSLRVPRRTYNLFYIQPPRFRAGCGGIDLTFGAFGYLQPEYLVEFGKQVMRQAPAFAFKTAIEVFCPTCAQVMSDLEDLANLFNSLQLDSCKAAQALFDSAGERLKSVEAIAKLRRGQEEFYEKTVSQLTNDVKELIKSFVDNNREASRVMRKIRDMLERQNVVFVSDVVKEIAKENWSGSTYIAKDDDFRRFMHSILGDVIILAGEGEEGDLTVVFESGCDNILRVKELIDSEQVSVTCGSNTVTFTVYSGRSGGGIRGWIKDTLDSIAEKIITKQPLEDRELEVLGIFPFPAYRLINAISVYPPALYGVTGHLADYLASELVKFLVLEYIRSYVYVLTSLLNSKILTQEHKDTIREALKALYSKDLKQLIEDLEEKKRKALDNIRSSIQTVREYERDMAIMFGNDPVYQSVMWGRSINFTLR